MRSVFRFVLPLVASTLLAGIASAKPELDAQGKCRDNGRFVAQSLCEAPAGKCRDITTKKFAKCGSPNTEPVPKSGSAGGTKKSK